MGRSSHGPMLMHVFLKVRTRPEPIALLYQ